MLAHRQLSTQPERPSDKVANPNNLSTLRDQVEVADITSIEIAQLASIGGGFDWLHESDEDDIYNDEDGEQI